MNIYISNLDLNITNEQLTDLFKQYGEVSSAEVIIDAFTDQSRGFAYVEMPVETDAQKAISQLNNTQLNSRTVSVQLAKPRETHKGSYPVGNGMQKSFGYFRGSTQNKKGAKRRIY